MRPNETTIKGLMRLVAAEYINERTVLLYMYYCSVDSGSPTKDEIKETTHLNLKTLRTHTKLLEELGAIELERRGNRVRVTAKQIKPTIPLPPSLENTLVGILDIRSQRSYALASYSSSTSIKRGEEGYGRLRRFTAADIRKDEDWEAAEKELKKYFHPDDYHPNLLTRKKYFTKLVELVVDPEFNFPKYCEWYAKNKYPDKGFSYGLFLYPGVISEFRANSETDDTYLKTTSRLKENETHKHTVKQTKQFINGLEDEDEK